MKFSSLFSATAFSFALAISAVLYVAPVNADDKPLTNADVEAIVKKVIQDNPDLILKSVSDYQLKQRADATSKAVKNIASMQGDINHDSLSPTVGDPNGDVTVVEFFDYHCGYCKHFFPSVTQLLQDDKKVRVVFKEFPILSEDSNVAATAALAVYNIDKTKYFPFHTLLMKSTGAFTVDSLADDAKQVGIDPAVFKKAMENPDISKELQKNKQLAQSLAISGTPAIIIGTELVPGAIDYDTLKAKIATARAAKKS